VKRVACFIRAGTARQPYSTAPGHSGDPSHPRLPRRQAHAAKHAKHAKKPRSLHNDHYRTQSTSQLLVLFLASLIAFRPVLPYAPPYLHSPSSLATLATPRPPPVPSRSYSDSPCPPHPPPSDSPDSPSPAGEPGSVSRSAPAPPDAAAPLLADAADPSTLPDCRCSPASSRLAPSFFASSPALSEVPACLPSANEEVATSSIVVATNSSYGIATSPMVTAAQSPLLGAKADALAGVFVLVFAARLDVRVLLDVGGVIVPPGRAADADIAATVGVDASAFVLLHGLGSMFGATGQWPQLVGLRTTWRRAWRATARDRRCP